MNSFDTVDLGERQEEPTKYLGGKGKTSLLCFDWLRSSRMCHTLNSLLMSLSVVSSGHIKHAVEQSLFNRPMVKSKPDESHFETGCDLVHFFCFCQASWVIYLNMPLGSLGLYKPMVRINCPRIKYRVSEKQTGRKWRGNKRRVWLSK